METVDHSLMEMINVKDYDVSILFNEERHQPRSSLEKAKKRSDRFETEDYYLAVSLIPPHLIPTKRLCKVKQFQKPELTMVSLRIVCVCVCVENRPKIALNQH